MSTSIFSKLILGGARGFKSVSSKILWKLLSSGGSDKLAGDVSVQKRLARVYNIGVINKQVCFLFSCR